MTATAGLADRDCITKSLGLKNCRQVIGNLDRKNIFYKKCFRHGEDCESLKNILNPIAVTLLQEQVNLPLTVIYVPLKWCGFAYKLFDFVLGNKQYYPQGSPKIPENRLFAQYHASQTNEMKAQIISQLCSVNSTVRAIFATVALGMGVDIHCNREVIHIGPPCTVKSYFQETGRAGRDGKPAQATLYYNNRDIAKNRVGMEDDMRQFCLSVDVCLRSLLLKSLDCHETSLVKPKYLCCNTCAEKCQCPVC